MVFESFFTAFGAHGPSKMCFSLKRRAKINIFTLFSRIFEKVTKSLPNRLILTTKMRPKRLWKPSQNTTSFFIICWHHLVVILGALGPPFGPKMTENSPRDPIRAPHGVLRIQVTSKWCPMASLRLHFDHFWDHFWRLLVQFSTHVGYFCSHFCYSW